MSSESCSSSFIFLRTNSSYFFIPSSFQFILVHWNSPGSLLSPYSPRALTIFLDPQITICQLFGPDSEGVWESTHKVSADSVEGNGSFCKKCNFALWKNRPKWPSAYTDIIRHYKRRELHKKHVLLYAAEWEKVWLSAHMEPFFLALSAYLTVFDKKYHILTCRDKRESDLIVLQQNNV